MVHGKAQYYVGAYIQCVRHTRANVAIHRPCVWRTQDNTHTQTHTHTHSLSLSLSLSHTHTHSRTASCTAPWYRGAMRPLVDRALPVRPMSCFLCVSLRCIAGYMYTHTYARIYTRISILIHMHTHIRIYICACICIHIHMHTYARVYVYTYICTHIYAYTCLGACDVVWCCAVSCNCVLSGVVWLCVVWFGVVCGVWCVVCGVWCVVYGMWCGVVVCVLYGIYAI